MVASRSPMNTQMTRWYREYNASTIMSDGVVTPESDLSRVHRRELVHAEMLKNKYVYVIAGHPVMDLIKYARIVDDIKAFDVAHLGLYRVSNNVFDWCINEIQKCLAIVRIQRWYRAASWRAQMPPMNSVKAFEQTAMGNALPNEIFRKIVVQYFNTSYLSCACAK